MKKTTTLCVFAYALIIAHNSFGMALSKIIQREAKYRQKMLQQILGDNRFDPDNKQYWHNNDYSEGWQYSKTYLPLRNQHAINILEEHKREIDSNIDLLKKQEALALENLSKNTDKIKRLEDQIQESLIESRKELE